MELVFTRNVKRASGKDVLDGIARKIAKIGCANGRGKGWKVNVDSQPKADVTADGTRQEIKITFDPPSSANPERVAEKFSDVAEAAIMAAAKLNPPWFSVGNQAIAKKVDKALNKSYGDINLERDGYFDNLYNLDSHIEIVYRSLKELKRSNLMNRHHCVLHGPPGCGKTELTRCMQKMLGEENVNWMMFDATAMTEAGVIKILQEESEGIVPPVLFVEELEKVPESIVRWMLGLLDQRGEVRKTNFKIGNRACNVRMMCVATVNDMYEFNKMLAGALASRFCHKVSFHAPTREIIAKILSREIAKVGGDERWIEPTLTFCYDRLGLTDPRAIVPICLNGREKLLSGEYQLHKLRTLELTDAQKAEFAKELNRA